MPQPVELPALAKHNDRTYCAIDHSSEVIKPHNEASFQDRSTSGKKRNIDANMNATIKNCMAVSNSENSHAGARLKYSISELRKLLSSVAARSMNAPPNTSANDVSLDWKKAHTPCGRCSSGTSKRIFIDSY